MCFGKFGFVFPLAGVNIYGCSKSNFRVYEIGIGNNAKKHTRGLQILCKLRVIPIIHIVVVKVRKDKQTLKYLIEVLCLFHDSCPFSSNSSRRYLSFYHLLHFLSICCFCILGVSSIWFLLVLLLASTRIYIVIVWYNVLTEILQLSLIPILPV